MLLLGFENNFVSPILVQLPNITLINELTIELSPLAKPFLKSSSCQVLPLTTSLKRSLRNLYVQV